MSIEFNNKGIPICGVYSNAVIVTTGDATPVVSSKSSSESPVSIGRFKYFEWGSGDTFPVTALANTEDVKGVPVLNRALNILHKIYCGQGIVPVRIIDYNEKGEVYEIVKELIPTLSKPWVRSYISHSFRDILKLGNAFVQFRPTQDYKQISRLTVYPAQFCRLSYIEKLYAEKILTGVFPDAKEENVSEYTLLNGADPEFYLASAMQNKTFFMQLKNDFSNAPYYAAPDWTTGSTYISVSKKLATMMDKSLDNIMNINFLIRIPYSFWEMKYPEDQYPDIEAKKAMIEADIEAYQTNFTTVENAKKTLVTMFGENPEKPEADKWEVVSLETKMPTDVLQNASNADAQIAIAAGAHPDIMGLIFGNSKGGSMQREILLLLYALSWPVRQLVLDPLEMMIRFNEPKYEDVELRFINTFLTTLDTGGGTGKTLS